jgi:RNA polymerase sigma factor (sigma-70 family)
MHHHNKKSRQCFCPADLVVNLCTYYNYFNRLAEDIKYLLQECLAGKRQAQEQLYRLFSARMYGVCLRYCRDVDEAKDVLQEGFLKVFSKLDQFHFTGSFEGWIRRIVVNTAIEKLRMQRKLVSIDQLAEVADETDVAELPAISQKTMMEMIQELPTQYKLVFNLYVFEEMSHKEIAAALKISEGGSKSNLSRARAILQHKIKTKIGDKVRIFGT